MPDRGSLSSRLPASHIAPVTPITLGRARDIVAGEVVDMRQPLLREHRDDARTHVVRRGCIGRIGTQDVDQGGCREDVIAHGHVGQVG